MGGISREQVRAYLGIDGAEKGAKKLETLDGVDVLVGAEILKRGKQIRPTTSAAATKVLLHCAFKLDKAEAKASIEAFLSIGLDSYIQGVTGYLPEAYAESTLEPRYRITRLVRDANPWRRLYSKEVCDRYFFGTQLKRS